MPKESTQPRRVESHDPSLSPSTNRHVSAELQDIVGAEVMEVPVSRHDAAGDRHATHTAGIADVVNVRLALVVTALVLLVTGGVAMLGGDSVALLAVVVAAMMGALAVIVLMVNRMTGEREHPSPELSAALEDEGVADPGRLLTDLADEFRDASTAR